MRRNRKFSHSYEEDLDSSEEFLLCESSENKHESTTSQTQIPVERKKTLIFLIYMITIAFCSTLTMQITNERAEHDHKIQPPMKDLTYDFQKYLSDKYSKNHPGQNKSFESLPGIFSFTEIWGFSQTVLFLCFLAFHKHRQVILRRFFFIWGTVYLPSDCR